VPAAIYYAPSYFSPAYFPTFVLESTSTADGYGDRHALAAIVLALDGTGEFADVLLAADPEHPTLGGDRTPLAVVFPTDWTEADESDPTVNLRQVTYSLTLMVRGENPAQRYELLDRLTSVAQNTLDGSDLCGGCLPALTKLRRGTYGSVERHPEQHVTLVGTFSYLVSSNTGHDASY
jgi:hypothetical protein